MRYEDEELLLDGLPAQITRRQIRREADVDGGERVGKAAAGG